MKPPRITKHYLDKVWQKMQRGKRRTAMSSAYTSHLNTFLTDEAYLLVSDPKTEAQKQFDVELRAVMYGGKHGY